MTSSVTRRSLLWVAPATLALVVVFAYHVDRATARIPGVDTRRSPSSLARANQVSAALDTPTITPTTSTTTPASTSTNTLTGTPTRTATPSCPQNYTITRLSSGTVVSGTTFVSGSDCDDCSVRVTLPF